jgi:hypothetical protein
MKVITRMADRLLGAVAPKITAGACCSESGQKYTTECYCRSSYVYAKNCVIGCFCQSTCGSCYRTNIQC